MQMQNTMHLLSEDFQEALGDMLQDYGALNNMFEDNRKILRAKYPKIHQDRIDYWASRITLFEYGNPGTTEIYGLAFMEPKKITLTLYPDYGS